MASATQRLRDQTRRTVGDQTVRAIRSPAPVSNDLVMQENRGNAVFYVDDVRYPKEVSPGGVADVEVDLVNERGYSTPLNPDQCKTGVVGKGLEAEVIVDPTWASRSTTTICVEGRGLTPTTETLSLDFPMPSDPGTYSFDLTSRATGSGTGGTQTYEIVIPSQNDGGSGPGSRPGANPNNGNDLPTDGIFSDTTLVALGGAAFALLALILS